MGILRCHIVDEFNRGIYDYVIATDEVPELQTASNASSRGRGGGTRGGRKGRRKDKEYGVARGIDFQGWFNAGMYVRKGGRCMQQRQVYNIVLYPLTLATN